MRLFISIGLPKGIRDYLFDLHKNLTKDIAVINWVAKKNIHLTLKFLGDVNEDKVEEIKYKLSEIKFEPFKTKLSGFGVFPSESYIRVLWVGLDSREIFDIQDQVDEKLSDLFPKERGFTTHLTLGRVKAIKNKERFLDLIKKIKIEPFEFEISEINLIKSELTKEGPKYTVLL